MNDFINAMAEIGLTPPDVLNTDGGIHRFGEGNKGWYTVHSPDAGSYGNWGDEEGTRHWFSDSERTPEETRQFAKERQIRKEQNRKETLALRLKCRAKAKGIWDDARDGGSEYLSRKLVSLNGARTSNGRVVVPVRDAKGVLHGIQYIHSTGRKEFLKGTAKKGCYFSMGKPSKILYICEGFATGASVRECTEQAVAVAFDAGNMVPVASALRAKLPDIGIVICADNDPVGIKKGRQAADACGGTMVMPETEGMDFNDLLVAHGAGAVLRQLTPKVVTK